MIYEAFFNLSLRSYISDFISDNCYCSYLTSAPLLLLSLWSRIIASSIDILFLLSASNCLFNYWSYLSFKLLLRLISLIAYSYSLLFLFCCSAWFFALSKSPLPFYLRYFISLFSRYIYLIFLEIY